MKQIVHILLIGTAILLLCLSTSVRAYHFLLVASPIRTHQERQSTVSPKLLLQKQSRFVKECVNTQLHYPKKVAYLTFDDGPNKHTSRILNILEKENAKATFFLIGSHAARYPQTLQRMVQNGHYLGLHTMSHDAAKLYGGNPDILIMELQQTKDAIAAITGVTTNLVRVPYGSKPYLQQPYRDALADSHFKLWDWTIDTDDWKQKQTAASLLNIVSRQATHDTEVILLHDSALTIQVLPSLIRFLHEHNYELLPYSTDYHVEVNFWQDARL